MNTVWKGIGPSLDGITPGTCRRSNRQYGKLGAGAGMCKAFVDRHRKGNEKHFEIGEAMFVFWTCMGQMPRKLWFCWIGLYWITNVENNTFELGTLAGEVVPSKVKGFGWNCIWGLRCQTHFRKNRTHWPWITPYQRNFVGWTPHSLNQGEFNVSLLYHDCDSTIFNWKGF